MNRPQEIEFSKKRIIEQNAYIRETARKRIPHERKRELLFCAIVIRRKFRFRLTHLVGLAGYVCFRLYEEF